MPLGVSCRSRGKASRELLQGLQPLGPHRRNGSHRIGGTVGGTPFWGALLMRSARWGGFGPIEKHRLRALAPYDNPAEIGTGTRLDALHAAQSTPPLIHKPDRSVRCATVSHTNLPLIAVVDPSRLLLSLRPDDSSCPFPAVRWCHQDSGADDGKRTLSPRRVMT